MNGYFLSKQETFNVNAFILLRKNADIYVSVDNLFFPVLFFDYISDENRASSSTHKQP